LDILRKLELLRSVLKRELAKHGVTGHWVMEGWRDLLGVKNANKEEDIVSLRHITAVDNVH
jgi:hypothetical protein